MKPGSERETTRVKSQTHLTFSYASLDICWWPWLQRGPSLGRPRVGRRRAVNRCLCSHVS